MRKGLSRWIYYRICRLSIKAKWSKNKSLDLSKSQKTTMDITLALIVNPNSELFINPTIDEKVGKKYYVKFFNDRNEVEKFATISETSSGWSVSLIGHELIDNNKYNYHFDVWYNSTGGKIIVDKFLRVIKHRRDEMEREIRKDDEKTLELVLNKIKK